MSDERKLIEINVTVKRVLYYDSNTLWGAYAVVPNNNDTIELNSYGNFVVTGNSARLMEYKDYNLIIEPTHNKKHGDGYSIVSVESKRPKTIAEQQAYVKAIVTEKRYEEIIKAYPNHPLLDMFENNEIDHTKIKGFGDITYEKVRQDLLNNLEIQEALVELKEFDITYEATKKLIEHFGSAAVLVQKVRENIYNLCKVDNFGFKKVDSYAMNRGDDPTSDHRIISAIEYKLDKDASSGHSWKPKRELINETQELLDIDERYIEDVLESIKVRVQKEEPSEIYIEGNKVALSRNHYFESKIKEKLMELLKNPVSTRIDNIDGIIKEQESSEGFKYSNDQRNAIKLAVNNNVLAINGRAGSGKSFSVKGIIHALQRNSDVSYMSCALSGKAAQVLSNQGILSMTIHRMLGVTPEGGFAHNAKNPLPYDVVILDEASMANNYLIYSIVMALKDGAKMIFVGDNGQLPSIGTGAVFDDILTTNVIPKQELTKIHRQAAKSGILSTANEVREGHQITKRYGYEQETVGELRDMTILPVDKETDIVDIISKISERNTNADLYDFQVITGLRERGDLSVKELNIELQSIFNDLSKPFISRGGYDYRVGDKIIHGGNNYEAGEEGNIEIYNGTMGKIVHIEFDKNKTKNNHLVHIQFEGIPEIIIYDMNEMQQIELAYAITVHRSQGQSIKNVIFTFDFSSYMLLSREFVYTGITRASEGCIMICENNALHYAIEQIAGGSRRTFLGDMLINESEENNNLEV